MLMVKIYDKGDCDENSCDQPRIYLYKDCRI